MIHPLNFKERVITDAEVALVHRVKLTGHRSEELERYKHLTVELIAGKLSRQISTNLGTSAENTKDQPEDWSNVPF